MNRQAPRLVVAAAGDPFDPSTWSGIPASLIKALSSAGYSVMGVSAQPPKWARGVIRLPGAWRASAFFYDSMVRMRWPAVEAAAIIQIGSEYVVPPRVPLAAYEDMTVAQAVKLGHPFVRRMPQARLRRWMERERALYAGATACCVASEWNARSLREDYGVPDHKIHVVGFGPNHRVEPDVAKRATVPSFLFIGRDWDRKNGGLVVEAFRRVRTEHPTAELHLVGGHPAIDVAGVIGHGRLRLSNSSDRAKVAELLQRCTCFVMPSQIEPFGIAYIEAAVAGVPSIGTTVGAAPEILSEDTGRVVSPGDLQALVAAMRELSNLDLALRMGASARMRARTMTWEAVARRIVNAALGLEAIEPSDSLSDPTLGAGDSAKRGGA